MRLQRAISFCGLQLAFAACNCNLQAEYQRFLSNDRLHPEDHQVIAG
jgi:hypothetical protein